MEIGGLERALAKAELDLETAQAQLAEAEQSHADDLARAQLKLELTQAQLDAGSAEARSQLSIKHQQLARLRAQDPAPKKAKAEAEQEQARLRRDQAQAAYDAIAWRGDVGASVEAAQLQQAALDYQKAQANYDLALQTINTHSNDLAIAQQEVAQAQLELDPLQDPDLNTSLEQAVALAQLELDILARGVEPDLERQVVAAQFQIGDFEAQIAEARILAPISGEIISLSITPGRAVEAYKAVIIVADPADLELSAELSAEQMGDLNEGMAVKLVPINYPGQTISGLVRQLPYPYGSGGGSQSLDDADTATRITPDFSALPAGISLEAGDLVRATAIIERKSDVLWLPPAAIRTFGGRKFVVIQDGDVQRRVDVVVGIESEDRVEIGSGVEEGWVVVGQ